MQQKQDCSIRHYLEDSGENSPSLQEKKTEEQIVFESELKWNSYSFPNNTQALNHALYSLVSTKTSSKDDSINSKPKKNNLTS